MKPPYVRLMLKLTLNLLKNIIGINK